MKRRTLVGLLGLVTACAVCLVAASSRADACFGSNYEEEIHDSGGAGAGGAVSMKSPGRGGFAFGFVAVASIGMCWVFLRRSDERQK